MTYVEFYEKHYLPWCYRRHQTEIDGYFLKVVPEWFQKLKLNQIETQEIELLQSHFIQKSYTTYTCNRYIGILKVSMTNANDWKFISEQRLKEIRKVKPIK